MYKNIHWMAEGPTMTESEFWVPILTFILLCLFVGAWLLNE